MYKFLIKSSFISNVLMIVRPIFKRITYLNVNILGDACMFCSKFKFAIIFLMCAVICCSCDVNSANNLTSNSISKDTIKQFTVEYLKFFKNSDFETLSYYTNFSLSNLEAFVDNDICGDYIKSNLQEMNYTINAINHNTTNVTINYIDSKDVTTDFILNSVYKFIEDFIDEDILYEEFMSLKENYPNQKIGCVTVNLNYIIDYEGNIKLEYTPETSDAFYTVVSSNINEEIVNYLF